MANIIELNSNLPMDQDASQFGAILALVVSEDVNCRTGEMTAYQPGDYLFGDTLIKYVDTELLAETEEDGDADS